MKQFIITFSVNGHGMETMIAAMTDTLAVALFKMQYPTACFKSIRKS